MQTDYTDRDTEDVRRYEGSSAGVQTQQLAPVQAAAYTAHPAQRRNNVVALALVAIGVLMVLGRFSVDSGSAVGGMVLLTIASVFLFFSFWKRIYGLLIPGSILAGLSIGVTFATLTNGISVLWGLALGFIGILFIGRALFNVRSNWPIYPAIPLFAVGVLVAIANLPWFFAGGVMWLPLLLIGLGLYLGWGRRP